MAAFLARGAERIGRMVSKKGPTKGSGGKHRNKLKGKGPTPKAEDRVYHKAFKAKRQAEKRQRSDPRLAARRRVAKFTSDSDDLVIGRNAVLEALRVGVPASTLYVASRLEHDDRTREIVRLAGTNGLNLLEADRLEMDRIARSTNHQGVIMKAQPFQYSSLIELAERAERKAKAMEAANSAAARIAARPLFIALDGITAQVLVLMVDVGRSLEGVGTRLCDGVHTASDEVGLAHVVGRDDDLQLLDGIDGDGVSAAGEVR